MEHVHLSNLDVLYGILDSPRKCLALNHLIILGKYFLYVNTGLKNKVQFNEYISLVRDKLALEKHIAIKSGKYENYIKKWNFIQNI